MKQAHLQHTWQEIWVTRRLLLVSVVIAACTLLMVFGSYSFWGQIRSTQSITKQEEAELEKARKRAQVLLDISEEDRASFDRAGIALPMFKEPLLVLRNLEHVSTDAQVGLGEIKINPGLISTDSASRAGTSGESGSGGSSARSSRARTPARVQELAFDVEITGAFSNIARAIEAIEGLAPIMEVTEISLDPKGRTEEIADSDTLADVQYTARLQLRTFYAELDTSSLARGTAVALTAMQQLVQAEVTSLRTPEEVGTLVLPDSADDFENLDFFGLKRPAVSPTPRPTPGTTASPAQGSAATPTPESTQ